jgi:adenine-specific DNA-methyltransferase
MSKKELGQYFTKNEELQEWVFQNVQHTGESLLEPSFGEGHLLVKFLESDPEYPITCCEMDTTLVPVVTFNEHQSVKHGDFLAQTLGTFKTIVGNPPYVKMRGKNLYIQFIERCFDLLEDGGEMLMIVPSDFIKVTSAAKIITAMTAIGSFTHFWFPHDESLFEDAAVDVVLFRYQKGVMGNNTNVNGKPSIYTITSGILSFGETSGTIISELFDAYVGIVSGKDEVYRVPFGNIQVLVDKDQTDAFLYATSFPTPDEVANQHLLTHKEVLMSRKIKKFNETNWFEWGAPRNIKVTEERKGDPCIYVRNLTRKSEIAWKGTVGYFGGTLLCLIPKQKVNIDTVVSYLNSDDFQSQYKYSDRFKIGHKQLSCVRLPGA